jgi:hypothetical protein
MSNTCDYSKLYLYLKDSLNKYQSSLHKPEDLTKSSDYEGNILHTPFYKDYKRSSWYFQYPEIISGVYIGDDSGGNSHLYSYKVKTSAHLLYNTDLCQKFPSIVCKEGYRAKWIKNPGSNILESGSFTFNDTVIQSLDYIYNDLNNEFMLSPSEKEIKNINIGNISMLQEFSEKLPSYETSLDLHWFYQEYSALFPLFYCSILDRIEHKLLLRRNINDLLIVIDSNGDFVDADITSILKINDLDLINENLTLPLPQMWGTYIYLSDFECDINRNLCESGIPIHEKRNIFTYTDMIKLENDNPVTLGTTINIKIPNTEFEVTNISWVAQNQNSLDLKNYSNYSTNCYNSVEGWSPISTTSLSYGKSLIFKDMPAFRTQRIYPKNQCCSITTEPGMNNWCMGIKMKDWNNNHIPGVVIKDGFISLKLADMNPFKNSIQKYKKCDDYFKIFVYLTVSKRLIFENYAVDEKSRNISSQINGTNIRIEGYE